MNKDLRKYFTKTSWQKQQRTERLFVKFYIDLRGTMKNGDRLVSHAYSNAAIFPDEIDNLPPAQQVDELKRLREESAIATLSDLVWPFLKDNCLNRQKVMPYNDPDNLDEGVTQEEADRMNSKYESMAIETRDFYYKIPVTDISAFRDGKWENIETIIGELRDGD